MNVDQQPRPSDRPRPDPEGRRRFAQRPSAGEVIAVAPGLARIAAGAWWRTAEWTVGVSARGGIRVLRAATSGESTAELLDDVSSGVRVYARRLLGLIEGDADGDGGPDSAAADGRSDRRGPAPSPSSLRERGDELLRRSADVDYEVDAHPAFERILGEMAPDEARILRLLALEGPQPTVDVRAGKPLNVGSALVVGGLSMIGPAAGVRYLERVPAYLNNLSRLGLIWFSREPLGDPLRYQVLEAQPDVKAALRKPGRARTMRRSIHLTPFGEDFCQTCLPLHTGEIDALGGELADGSGVGGPATAD